jgi:transcription initiation factor TFIIIB Brf1 subunit/transcription initiation factor TFIIB
VSQTCKLNVSKRDVKNVSETSEVTINKCYKKLEKIAKDEMIIPAAILKKYA